MTNKVFNEKACAMTPLSQPLEKNSRVAHFSRNASVVTLQNVRGAILQPACLRKRMKEKKDTSMLISPKGNTRCPGMK